MNKIFYWIATVMMCAIFLFSAGMYLLKYEMVTQFYDHLGFPTWIIYPSAIAKIVAVALVLIKQPKVLMEWAYAGLFIDAALATVAHHHAGDGIIGLSLFALIATVCSRIFLDKLSA